MAWTNSPVDKPVQVNHAARNARAQHKPFAVTLQMIATDSGAITLVTAVNARHTIFVTKIVVTTTTDAAQSLAFADSASSPVPIITQKVSPGLGANVWDFTEDGIPLTEGKNLTLTPSAAGLAGIIHVEGYQKLTGVGAA